MTNAIMKSFLIRVINISAVLGINTNPKKQLKKK